MIGQDSSLLIEVTVLHFAEGFIDYNQWVSFVPVALCSVNGVFGCRFTAVDLITVDDFVILDKLPLASTMEAVFCQIEFQRLAGVCRQDAALGYGFEFHSAPPSSMISTWKLCFSISHTKALALPRETFSVFATHSSMVYR